MAAPYRRALLRNPASSVLANIQEGRIYSVAFVADIGPGYKSAGFVFSGICALAGPQQSVAPRNKTLQATTQPLRGFAAPEPHRYA